MGNSKQKPIILIGGGGHASILADILLGQGRTIGAIISPDDLSSRPIFTGIPQLHSDQDIHRYSPQEVELVNGIGMLPRSDLKKKLNNFYLDAGYRFATVISDSAEVSPNAKLSDGVQILSQALIQTGAVIGPHTIINSRALVEHDCKIGSYNHAAPGALICGQVETGTNVYIGAGAVIFQNLIIGDNSIIGAGTTLNTSLPQDSITYPARYSASPQK